MSSCAKKTFNVDNSLRYLNFVMLLRNLYVPGSSAGISAPPAAVQFMVRLLGPLQLKGCVVWQVLRPPLPSCNVTLRFTRCENMLNMLRNANTHVYKHVFQHLPLRICRPWMAWRRLQRLCCWSCSLRRWLHLNVSRG